MNVSAEIWKERSRKKLSAFEVMMVLLEFSGFVVLLISVCHQIFKDNDKK